MAVKPPSKAALTKFEEEFKKTFGDSVKLSRVSSAAADIPYDVVSTGILTLDYALGVGGFVKGRIVESWGPEGVGKTTVALLAIAAAQKAMPDKTAVWVDMEQTLDLRWARALGVDIERLWVAQPDSAETVADIVAVAVRNPINANITLDSIGSMISKSEKEKAADEASVGRVPKVVTRMVNLVASEAPKTGAVFHIINQVRANLGYGADTTTGGGFALKHCTTHRLKYGQTQGGTLMVGSKENSEQAGKKISILVEKNKVAVARRTAVVTYLNQTTEKYGPIGVDNLTETFNIGKKTGVIKQSGRYYTLPDGGRHEGADAVMAYLKRFPIVQEEIRAAVLRNLASTVVKSVEDEGEDE